jgi:hypothetical protein
VPQPSEFGAGFSRAWENARGFFQGLEKLAVKFSNPWKFRSGGLVGAWGIWESDDADAEYRHR